MPGGVLSMEGLGVGALCTFCLGGREKRFQAAQVPLRKAMLACCLDDELHVRKIGRVVLTPRWHVANGRQHSVVAGFHDHRLGKKDANPVS